MQCLSATIGGGFRMSKDKQIEREATVRFSRTAQIDRGGSSTHRRLQIHLGCYFFSNQDANSFTMAEEYFEI